MSDEEKSSSDNRPLIILIIGILSVVSCPILGPVAIIMGGNYKRDAIVEGVEPDQLASVGRILGFVGTALILLWLLMVGLGIAFGVLGAVMG